MADDDLQNFSYKFCQLWSQGRRANLQMECVNGRAWVILSTDLGPWRPPTHYSRQNPRPSRPRCPPKSPGKTPPARPHDPTPYNTIQHHTTPYNTIHHHTTPYDTIQHHTTPYNTIQHHTTPYPTIQHHTTPYNTIQHHTTPYNT